MKILINFTTFFIVTLMMSGCLYLNDRGVSNKYYNDCKEYYDATGTYRKSCPKNIIGWSE